MKQHKRRHNAGFMLALIFLTIIIAAIFHYRAKLTGINELDGMIAVWFGLYICSHPAANFLEIIVFHGDARMLDSIRRSALSWMALNMLVMLAGFILVMIGTTRFFSGW